MTATILLIRHAAHAQLGEVLSGRTGGGSLTELGADQARDLAQRLAGEPIAEVHSSPVLRARETARHIAAPHAVEVTVATQLDEIDFGEWAGKRFDDLADDPAWREWNDNRAQARAPEGETMEQVQRRVGDYMRAVAGRLPGKRVAMVSHCDAIRAAVAQVLGLSLDHLLRFDVAPASVSRIEAGSWGARVLSLNEVAA